MKPECAFNLCTRVIPREVKFFLKEGKMKILVILFLIGFVGMIVWAILETRKDRKIERS